MQTSVKHSLLAVIGIALLSLPLHAEILYAANADASSVSAYHIAGNGALKPIVGSTIPSGTWPVSIAVDLLGRFLFTANMGDDTISAYRIRPNGSLTHLSDSKTGSMPESLAIDPFGRFLYVTNLDGEGIPGHGGTVGHVSAYHIAIDGTLTPVFGSPFAAGFSPLTVKTDPLGRFVYVGNAGSQEENTETVSGYRVGGNGALIPLPNSPFRDGESPQSLAVDPFGRFLYTAGEYDLALLTYRIAGNGNLTNLPGSSFRAGNGFEPWNAVAADPFGRFIYTSSGPENNPANATFSVYRVGANGLTFGSSYPAGFVADSMVADFTGQFFYAAMNIVKGASQPVDGNGIAAYRIMGNSTLIQVPGSPFEVGFSPDSMAICPFP
jgi:6-phosphogluconolactonase (cycloisomerase 2 family)